MIQPLIAEHDLTVYVGHALEVLVEMPSGSVDCIVTSPPYYGLRDYGTDPVFWPAMNYRPMADLPMGVDIPAMTASLGLEPDPWAYVGHLVEIFAEARRVLSDHGVMWVNLGDSYAGKANGGQAYDRHRGHGHRSKQGIIPRRINNTSATPYKSMLDMPARLSLALVADGWIKRNDVIWNKPNAMPESVGDRLSSRHEHLFLFSKTRRYWFDLDAIREPHARDWTPGANGGRRMSGGAAWDRGDHLNAGLADAAPHPSGRNPGDVWTIPTQPYPDAHFAAFPAALARRCILSGCPAGAAVLDPFAGTGTTLAVARQLGRRGIGIELSSSYVADHITKRVGQPTLELTASDS